MPSLRLSCEIVGIRSAAHAWHLRTNVEAIEPPHEIETGLSEALPDFRVGPADVPQRFAHVPPETSGGDEPLEVEPSASPVCLQTAMLHEFELESSTQNVCG